MYTEIKKKILASLAALPAKVWEDTAPAGEDSRGYIVNILQFTPSTESGLGQGNKFAADNSCDVYSYKSRADCDALIDSLESLVSCRTLDGIYYEIASVSAIPFDDDLPVDGATVRISAHGGQK